MPIYKGREFVERLNKGDESYVRRTEKGKELTYGLYDIRYFDGQPATNDYSDHLKEQQEYKKLYAWGKNRWLPTLPEDPDEYEYLTHNFGWYNKPDYSLKQTYKSDRPMIDYREHINLDLYSKWRQKRFQFEGTILIQIEGEGSGEIEETEDGQVTGSIETGEWKDWSYPYTVPGGMGYPRGQCTWWACGRVKQTGGGESAAYQGNAANWSVNSTTIKAGSVLVFDDGGYGHVVFVEAVKGDQMLVSEAANSKNHPGWLRCQWESISALNNNKCHWLWSDEKFKGVFNSGASGGDVTIGDNGGEFMESVEVYVERQDVSDQKNPSIPDPSSLGYEDGEWVSQTSYTMERTTEYDESGDASWSSWEDKYTEDGDNFHLEWEDY